MDDCESKEKSVDYWYQEDGAVKNWFYGVFEGGGAKGVAFSGALIAMKEEHCWFRGVAGSSAGAITAALVASGVSPDEIEQLTDSALKQIQTNLFSGLRRLYKESGYFPSKRLKCWLNEQLRKQVAKKQYYPINSKDEITFQQLYDATGIELNVVAADLSLKRQVISVAMRHHTVK